MKHRCFCHKPYREITNDEARAMLRSARRWTVGEFMDYYGIPKTEVWAFITARGMKMTAQERRELREWEKRNENKPETVIDPHDVSKWPKSVVAALGNVSYETANGKRLYDAEALNRATEELQNRIDLYHSEKVESSALKKSDLIAMRYYRGKSRKDMAREMLTTPSEIERMENESPIPKSTEKTYKEVLGIKNSHINQLRQVMKGKLDRVDEDRTIPNRVKVRVYGRDNGQCTECGSTKKLHFHHIQKFSEGGQNTAENLKLLCAACHAEEHKDDPSYYMLKKMAEGD